MRSMAALGIKGTRPRWRKNSRPGRCRRLQGAPGRGTREKETPPSLGLIPHELEFLKDHAAVGLFLTDLAGRPDQCAVIMLRSLFFIVQELPMCLKACLASFQFFTLR
jgi:hypothetical protein